VILSRGHAAEALEWTRNVMTRIGLTLNETKTKIREARTERFDFLGYTFGPHRYRKDGHWYLGASPSKKSVLRVKQQLGDLLQPSKRRELGTGSRSPQSDSERVVCVLQLWNPTAGVSGG
jgi:hypothetical protein